MSERRAGHDCDRDGCSDTKIRAFHHGLTDNERAVVDRIVGSDDPVGPDS